MVLKENGESTNDQKLTNEEFLEHIGESMTLIYSKISYIENPIGLDISQEEIVLFIFH